MANKIFPGFQPEDFTNQFFKYPKALEGCWHLMTPSESVVLLFVLRQIAGFKDKTEDAISLSQFVSGIGAKNKGTGLSRSQVRRAIAGLEEKGFIIVIKRPGRATMYRLRYTESPTVAVTAKQAPLEIQRLIRLFTPVAEHRVESYLQDKRQIKAMETLVKYFGVETVETYINVLPTVLGKKFMPTITSPVELEQKLPKLMVALKRRKDEEGSSQMMF